MPYIGRELDSGNYLKLDDISSSFNGSTTTFNLTAGGKAFFPGSAFSILVNLAGVAQEPEVAYQTSNSQITFASAPASGDQFFCTVLGLAHGVSVPGNGSVNGAQLAKPFNYDGFFYLDDANNRVGVGTATPAKPLHVVGEGQFDSVRVLGDLTVDGTTTTLDTVVTEVDRLEVGANNSTVGLAVTQSGSGRGLSVDGDAVISNTGANPLDLYKYGTNAPSILMYGANGTAASPTQTQTGDAIGGWNAFGYGSSGWAGGPSVRITAIATENNGTTSNRGADIKFETVVNGGVSLQERMRLTNAGNLGIGLTNPLAKLHLKDSGTLGVVAERTGSAAAALQADSVGTVIYSQQSYGSSTGVPFRIITGAVERLRITPTGRVGIGTNDPQSKFEVCGTSPIVRSKHSTSQKYTQINHNGTDGYVDWSSGELIFRGASSAERLRIDSAGNIGIGTDTFTATNSGRQIVEINGTTMALINLDVGGTRKAFYYTDGTDVFNYNTVSGSYIFGTNNTEKLRITSAGNVGIGLTNPAHKLDVYLSGRLNQLGQGGYGLLVGPGSNTGGFTYMSTGDIEISTSQTSKDIVFSDAVGGNQRMRLTGDTGRLGIGTDNPQKKLHVSGTSDFVVDTDFAGLRFGSYGEHDIALVTGRNTPSGSSRFYIENGNGEALRITSTGKVGVGAVPAGWHTAASSSVIQVGSSVLFDFSSAQFDVGHNYYYDGSNYKFTTTGYAARMTFAKSDGSIRFWSLGTGSADANATVSEKMRMTAGGKVGIGTNVPDYDLHVYGGGDILVEDNNNGSAHLRMRSSNGGTDVSNWKIKTSSNNYLYIENDTVGGTSQFTINNSGKVGINDATPSVSLDLASNTDALSLPTGTTAQRPSGTDAYIRKNSTNNSLEFYNGTEWVEIITDYFPTGSTILG